MVKNINKILLIPIFSFFTIVFSGCEETDPINASKILLQLPDYNRVALVSSKLANFENEKFNTIFFDTIAVLQDNAGYKYDEEKFYKIARSLEVQYILISSDMTNKPNTQFPWMTDKNFRVCPGTIDHKTKTYYTLLVWDNSKNSYHFFKFLY